jgi:hypothetical protein
MLALFSTMTELIARRNINAILFHMLSKAEQGVRLAVSGKEAYFEILEILIKIDLSHHFLLSF